MKTLLLGISTVAAWLLGVFGILALWVYPLGDFMGYTLGWPAGLVVAVALMGIVLSLVVWLTICIFTHDLLSDTL